MLRLEEVAGGFADPVFDSQSVFRAMMDAMARPGSRRTIGRPIRPPSPLSATMAACALTLCDHETLIWLDAPLRTNTAVVSWLTFHTGAAVVEIASDAHFALVADPAELIALENFAQGTQEYPDRTATLILQVADLGSGERLLLSGPGIESQATIAPRPMPRHFVAQWRQNRTRFPRGLDLLLAAPGEITALPRTARIEAGEG